MMEERRPSMGAREVGSAGSNRTRRSCILGPSSTATSFVAEIERLPSGVPVLSVTGELDITTAGVFDDALRSLPGDPVGAVIVDLGRCSFIDLRGLRVLLAARERLERAHRPLALVVGKPSLLRIFNVTRVADQFEIYPSLAAAAQVNGRG